MVILYMGNTLSWKEGRKEGNALVDILYEMSKLQTLNFI